MSVPLVSQAFTPKPGLELATVAGGCFWGVEHIFRKYYDGKGLEGASVGYANGKTSDPTYKEVCSGQTNHAEAVQLLFDPAKVKYRDLVEFFLRIHDPTTVDFQGPDRGTQYRSAIFTQDDAQAREAREAIKAVQDKYYPKDTIVTRIEPLQSFWDAEAYHQKYLINNPGGYECPTHFLREAPQL